MYPDPLRPVSTDVCHYFVKEWQKMGHEVIVIHYRSIFPKIYTTLAAMFPRLAKWYIGNHVEMDRNTSVVEYEHDGVKVYSVPIFKKKPHGKFTEGEISKQVDFVNSLLEKLAFTPDAIIGHFFNPQLEIISRLRKVYPKARTCVVMHETEPSVVKGVYGDASVTLLNSIDVLGFRSAPMRDDFEKMYGKFKKTFVCYSGTPPVFLSTPRTVEKVFTDGKLSKYIYVGQFTRNKCVQANIEALQKTYTNDENYEMSCIGGGGTCFNDLVSYVNTNQLEEHILFLGKKNREDLIKYYDQSECFIMISLSEAFGLVYLEAMARGCICIGTRGQGIDGVIEDGVNGFLCDGGNSDELSNVLVRLNALSKEEKKIMSEKARATAEWLSDYNVAKMYIDNVI